MKYPLNIGLIGFGVVGEGVYNALNNHLLPAFNIKRILIRDEEKARYAPPELFTSDPSILLLDPEIDVVIELIDDATAAFGFVIQAMQNGKHVISANKKMIAEHLPALIRCQREHKVSFLYEAAVGGSLPLIRALEETYALDPIHACRGILNGSTNYILTQCSELGLSYDAALLQAQAAGFAESDPGLDVEGIDALNKLCILLKHGFGVDASPEDVFSAGITKIGQADYDYAKAHGWEIKLLATAFKVSDTKLVAYVLPQFVPVDHFLGQVRLEENAMVFESHLAGKQCISGKGAGRYPTASAVLSDLRTLQQGGKYQYTRSISPAQPVLIHQHRMPVYIRFVGHGSEILADMDTVRKIVVDRGQGYLLGEITIETLRNAFWSTQNEVSIIALPDAVDAQGIVSPECNQGSRLASDAIRVPSFVA